ncbi:hypothetical protein IWQ51_005208 [Labrenzia sp. EL_142]|nr:hypothetical protein [Labrenzia sp. EL_142]
MHPNDAKRLERERELYISTRGPDYSRVEEYIRRARVEAAKAAVARSEFLKRQKLRWMDIGEL